MYRASQHSKLLGNLYPYAKQREGTEREKNEPTSVFFFYLLSFFFWQKKATGKDGEEERRQDNERGVLRVLRATLFLSPPWSPRGEHPPWSPCQTELGPSAARSLALGMEAFRFGICPFFLA